MVLSKILCVLERNYELGSKLLIKRGVPSVVPQLMPVPLLNTKYLSI